MTLNLGEVKAEDTMTESMSAMDRVHATGSAFIAHLRTWDGEELQGEIVSAILEKATPESRAMIVFQALTLGSDVIQDDVVELTRADKTFALELAETMGPDWAPWLYNFTRLVTKLA